MSKREYMHREIMENQWPSSNEILVCKCGWYGRVEDQDALGSECGCCPDCGNEDLVWLSKLQEQLKEFEAELIFIKEKSVTLFEAKDRAKRVLKISK